MGELEELIECWTLDEGEFELVGNKSGATRLGFSLMLKFFELEARFPRRSAGRLTDSTSAAHSTATGCVS